MSVTRVRIVRQMMRAVIVSWWRPDEGDDSEAVRREKESVHRRQEKRFQSLIQGLNGSRGKRFH